MGQHICRECLAAEMNDERADVGLGDTYMIVSPGSCTSNRHANEDGWLSFAQLDRLFSN
jgi:hypothetical protein